MPGQAGKNPGQTKKTVDRMRWNTPCFKRCNNMKNLLDLEEGGRQWAVGGIIFPSAIRLLPISYILPE